MNNINPGLALFVGMMSIMTACSAGVYARYRLRNCAFFRSGQSSHAEMALLALSFTAGMSFGMCGMFLAMCVTLLFFGAIFAFSLWGANPPWGEW